MSDHPASHFPEGYLALNGPEPYRSDVECFTHAYCLHGFLFFLESKNEKEEMRKKRKGMCLNSTHM